MKGYLVVYGYRDEFIVDSVFLDKEKTEDYVKENNLIPFGTYYALRIEEVEFNPSVNNKKIVEIYGYINKNKEIRDFEIERIDHEGIEQLKDFTGENIVLHQENIIGLEEVTFFGGTIDVTSCKDLQSCDRYIKDIVMKKYCEYKNEK